MMLKGVDLIVLPTNWPPTSGLASEYVPNARALENHLYFISVNRVGTERGFSFIGKSKFCDPSGRDVDFANHHREAIIYGEVDPQRSRNKHLVNIPGAHEVHRTRDRRPEMYGDLVAPVQLSSF
jgi:predicted amidohydrolase